MKKKERKKEKSGNYKFHFFLRLMKIAIIAVEPKPPIAANVAKFAEAAFIPPSAYTSFVSVSYYRFFCSFIQL